MCNEGKIYKYWIQINISKILECVISIKLSKNVLLSSANLLMFNPQASSPYGEGGLNFLKGVHL